MLSGDDAEAALLRMSTLNEEGVINVKQVACDRLLSSRVEMKLKVRRLHTLRAPSAIVVAAVLVFLELPSPERARLLRAGKADRGCSQPDTRGNAGGARQHVTAAMHTSQRPGGAQRGSVRAGEYTQAAARHSGWPCKIAHWCCHSRHAAARSRFSGGRLFIERPSERVPGCMHLQEEQGGAGVYSQDMRALWSAVAPEQRHDVMPEIWDGHNIIDFVDPDIDAKLEALEREEEALAAEAALQVRRNRGGDQDAAAWSLPCASACGPSSAECTESLRKGMY